MYVLRRNRDICCLSSVLKIFFLLWENECFRNLLYQYFFFFFFFFSSRIQELLPSAVSSLMTDADALVRTFGRNCYYSLQQLYFSQTSNPTSSSSSSSSSSSLTSFFNHIPQGGTPSSFVSILSSVIDSINDNLDKSVLRQVNVDGVLFCFFVVFNYFFRFK
jgi:hypothetical protein